MRRARAGRIVHVESTVLNTRPQVALRGGRGNRASATEKKVIRPSFRAGSGLPNWVDQPRIKGALYSARKSAACSASEVYFPSPRRLPLPRPTEDRGSTIRARFGYPRTPRDGYVLVAPEGAPYTDLPVDSRARNLLFFWRALQKRPQ